MMTQNQRKLPAILKTAFSVPLILSLLIAGIACERTGTVVKNGDDATPGSDEKEQTAQTASDSVYQIVKHMPEFPGGERELMQYLGEVDYPPSAKDNKTQGKVYVRFIIDQSGGVGAVETARGTGTILDSAAVAHVRNMPEWTPGRNADGEKVKVQYVVPFLFKLDEEKEEAK